MKSFIMVSVFGVIIAVYFFVLRPSQIKSECWNESMDNSIRYVNSEWEDNLAIRTSKQEALAQQLYEGCLHNKGI